MAIIYIIVLLILTEVTIATLTRENGILTRAQEADAKEKTEEAEDIKKIRLAISEARIGECKYQEIDEISLTEALENQFEGKNIQITDKEYYCFEVNLNNVLNLSYLKIAQMNRFQKI